MKQPSHVIFKADPKEVAKFVEEFYGAGATQVLIADIEEHEGKQFGGGLLVVLPKDADARVKLFEIGSRARPFRMTPSQTRDKSTFIIRLIEPGAVGEAATSNGYVPPLSLLATIHHWNPTKGN
jgi:hypothetical protein